MLPEALDAASFWRPPAGRLIPSGVGDSEDEGVDACDEELAGLEVLPASRGIETDLQVVTQGVLLPKVSAAASRASSTGSVANDSKEAMGSLACAGALLSAAAAASRSSMGSTLGRGPLASEARLLLRLSEEEDEAASAAGATLSLEASRRGESFEALAFPRPGRSSLCAASADLCRRRRLGDDLRLERLDMERRRSRERLDVERRRSRERLDVECSRSRERLDLERRRSRERLDFERRRS